MQETENVDLVPKKKKRSPKRGSYRIYCVKVYLSKEELQRYAEEACKAGKRLRSLKLFRAKEHGFANEEVVNCKGIAKFIRDCCFPAWVKGEAERLIKKRELEEKAKELGLRIDGG